MTDVKLKLLVKIWTQKRGPYALREGNDLIITISADVFAPTLKALWHL